MTHFGKIKNYDTDRGTGMIQPEKGGDTLAFSKSDLQQEASEPRQGQRFSYETNQVDGGKSYAVNLRQQGESHSAQAEQAQKQAG